MKAKFWHERWESGQLGFHQSDVNADLAENWKRLALSSDAPIFVPLCGKSLDMGWLRDQGHPVIGIELSAIALGDYFDAAGIAYSKEPHVSAQATPTLERYTAPGYDLYCGDFFELNKQDLSSVLGVYDRAALIALPPEMRTRYAAKMSETLPDQAKILLFTIEYDQSKMKGPPHSVSPAEVESLFGATYTIERLFDAEPIAPPPPFQARGLDLWQEHGFLLTRTAIEQSNP